MVVKYPLFIRGNLSNGIVRYSHNKSVFDLSVGNWEFTVETVYLKANKAYPKTLLSLSTNLITTRLLSTWTSGSDCTTSVSLEPAVVGVELLNAGAEDSWKNCIYLINNTFSFNFGKNELEFFFRNAETDNLFKFDVSVFMLINFKRID